MDQALAARAIEHLHRLRVGGLDLAGCRGPHLLDGRAQLAALRAVEGGVGLGLTHTFLGGFDSRHDHLGLNEGTPPATGPARRT